MKEGWVCPKCGRCLSPWTFECPCYKREMSNAAQAPAQSLVRDYMVNPKIDYLHHDTKTNSEEDKT